MPNLSNKPNRIPPFHTVQTRARRDGWTPHRQAEFICHLAQMRCVLTAAREVGMGRESAYRLRTRDGAESFSAAWGAALAKPEQFQLRIDACDRARTAIRPDRKVTLGELDWRYQTGIWIVQMRRGQYAGMRRKADNCALLAMASRLGKSQMRWDAGLAV